MRVSGWMKGDDGGVGGGWMVRSGEGILKLSYPPAKQTIPGCPPSWCALSDTPPVDPRRRHFTSPHIPTTTLPFSAHPPPHPPACVMVSKSKSNGRRRANPLAHIAREFRRARDNVKRPVYIYLLLSTSLSPSSSSTSPSPCYPPRPGINIAVSTDPFSTTTLSDWQAAG